MNFTQKLLKLFPNISLKIDAYYYFAFFKVEHKGSMKRKINKFIIVFTWLWDFKKESFYLILHLYSVKSWIKKTNPTFVCLDSLSSEVNIKALSRLKLNTTIRHSWTSRPNLPWRKLCLVPEQIAFHLSNFSKTTHTRPDRCVSCLTPMCIVQISKGYNWWTVN
jgi:hypothetical protein